MVMMMMMILKKRLGVSVMYFCFRLGGVSGVNLSPAPSP